MATVPGHARKRQFQPSIDSYYSQNSSSSNSAHRASRAEGPPAPSIPSETQASLLSVGMRVRKSVPEGYKTHKTIGVHISTIASSAPFRLTTKTKQRYGDPKQRELMPMCGLHKTGGLAAQPGHSSAPATMYAEDEDEDEDEDGLPGLSDSQSTLHSTPDSFATASSGSIRKRGYEEEMEENLDAYFDNETAMDSHVLGAMNHGRPIAKMRLPFRVDPRRMVGVVGGDDFDEAPFLIPNGMDIDDA